VRKLFGKADGETPPAVWLKMLTSTTLSAALFATLTLSIGVGGILWHSYENFHIARA